MSNALDEFCMVPLHLFEVAGRPSPWRTVEHLSLSPERRYRVGDKIDFSFYVDHDVPSSVRATIVDVEHVRLLDVVDADLSSVSFERSEDYLMRWDRCESLARSKENPIVWRLRWVYDEPIERIMLP